MAHRLIAGIVVVLLCGVAAPPAADADPFIRAGFFTHYVGADTTRLHDLPSHPIHCGVCHLDFSGGGPRNHYGLRVQIGKIAGMTNVGAVAAAEPYDSDGDGIGNLLEITDWIHFGNTPTFPGLNPWNKLVATNIPLLEIDPYITPLPGTDTTAPSVTVFSPNGGEFLSAGTATTVSYSASDPSGILHVNVFLSDDHGTTWRQVARQEPGTGSFPLFIPNLPGSGTRVRVQALDGAGNVGSDDSNGSFTVQAVSGIVNSTLRDVALPGTQPFESTSFKEPEMCGSCHAVVNQYRWEAAWTNWLGSMVGQAARDPMFLAALAIAEQDAPSVGDLCLRCHSPGGWEEGRAIDTGGGLLNAEDRQGITCELCHRNVDWNYQAGISPPEDLAVHALVNDLPFQYANGSYISDPNAAKRGPLTDAVPSHQVLVSPFHGTANACGICHDSSNPLLERTGPDDYALDTLDAQHPTRDLRDMFPLGRTFSEWSQSTYAAGGVYAPEFAGNKPDGIVGKCQDCHMKDVTCWGASQPGAPVRTDWPLHDFAGANTFIPELLPDFYGTEVDTAALNNSVVRATSMLQLGATLALTPQAYGVDVRVTNQSGHKFPTGTEGRRLWINVRAVDGTGAPVFESGAYDAASAVLTQDEQVTVYEYVPGISSTQAALTGVPAGPSFHTVLNDTVYLDNRIPPRGFTNAGFAAVQAAPVGATYADGEYWDDADYFLPASAETAHVTLYYQILTREYAEFLRDANTTNSAGQDFYDAWVAHGKAAPVVVAQASTALGTIITDAGDLPAAPLAWSLGHARPNPFRGETIIDYSLAAGGRVRIAAYDLAGRRVRTLVDAIQEPGSHRVPWNGANDRGHRLGSGIYFLRYEAGEALRVRRVVLLN